MKSTVGEQELNLRQMPMAFKQFVVQNNTTEISLKRVIFCFPGQLKKKKDEKNDKGLVHLHYKAWLWVNANCGDFYLTEQPQKSLGDTCKLPAS